MDESQMIEILKSKGYRIIYPKNTICINCNKAKKITSRGMCQNCYLKTSNKYRFKSKKITGLDESVYNDIVSLMKNGFSLSKAFNKVGLGKCYFYYNVSDSQMLDFKALKNYKKVGTNE